MKAHSEWRDLLIDHIRKEALPVEKYSHQPRLFSLCLQIGEQCTYDEDTVFAAAWLHDLGIFSGHRPSALEDLALWDHTAYAMREAPGLLLRFGFPASKISAVIEVIRTHQVKDTPTTTESSIVRDADILEQLGSIAVLRTAAKVGRDTRFSTFAEVRKHLCDALEHLPSQLQFPQAKTLAAPRIAALRSFLDSLEVDAAGFLS